MAKILEGTVIEKWFDVPLGASGAQNYCYVMVQLESGERVSIRLHRKVVDQVTIGDRIRFLKPWRKKKRVKVEILEKTAW
jgi:uncharacterized OB-fold protein